MNGFFGNFFDSDNNGELDPFEQAADFSAFMNLVYEDEEDDEDEGGDIDADDIDADDDDDE